MTADQQRDRLVDRIGSLVGPANLITDPAEIRPYAVDWTGRFVGHSPLVVSPCSADEVAEVVRLLTSERIPFLAQGGNTGLVGGATPLEGEVVISTRRLVGARVIDLSGASLETGAGTTLSEVQQAAERLGYEFPVDFAARARATVGGMAATNAAGLRTLRHGRMASQIRSLSGVFANGETTPDNRGIRGRSSADLLIGSEGTLGIITSLQLALSRSMPARATALIGLGSLEAAALVVPKLISHLNGLDSLELLEREGIELFAFEHGLSPPLSDPVLLLLECASEDDPSRQIQRTLAMFDEIGDVLITNNDGERAALWSWREGQSETIQSLGVPMKFDVRIPIASVASFVCDIRAHVEEFNPEARVVIFGHIGVENLHVNLLRLSEPSEVLEERLFVDVAQHGGDIAAEHGIGRAKARYLDLTRSAEEVAAMANLKKEFDPAGLLNPGAMLPCVGDVSEGRDASG